MERKTGLSQISAKRLEQFGGRMPYNSLQKPGERKASKSLRAKPGTIGPDAQTVEAVEDRDQQSCVVCGRWLEPYGRGSSWSIHHRRRIRTDNRMCNLIAVCGGADVHGCHQEIHANVAKAEEAGWLVKKCFDPADKVMAHSQYGWVLLTPMGNVIQAIREETDEHPF